jgi:hypothetical protein
VPFDTENDSCRTHQEAVGQDIVCDLSLNARRMACFDAESLDSETSVDRTESVHLQGKSLNRQHFTTVSFLNIS